MAKPHVLTFNFHEPYLCLMAKTGYPFTIGLYDNPPLARQWQTKFRPVPGNFTFMEEAEWRRAIEVGTFDVVVAHNETNAGDLFRYHVPALLVCHNRRSFLKTTVSAGQGDPIESYNRLLDKLCERFDFVFISETKRDDYGIPGRVIPPGIDVEQYGGYTGEKAEVLRVGNTMRRRNLMFDVDFQEQVCAGVPNRVVGEDPEIPGARPANSFEELLDCYRGLRCYLHVTREAYEDGYNLAALEAMACGMPVVSLANPTSPITDGVDGFVSYEAAVLRTRLEELLENRDLAREIGARGRETVARAFPMEAFVERWRQAIEETAAGGPASTGSRGQMSKKYNVPTLRVVIAYDSGPHSPGPELDAALRGQGHQVVAAGTGCAQAPKGYAPVPETRKGPGIRFDGNQSYASLLAQFPQDFEPGLYLHVDTGETPVPPDLHLLNCVKVCQVTRPDGPPSAGADVARRFNFTFVGQKRQLDAFVEMGVPNVAWLPPACSQVNRTPVMADRPLDTVVVGADTAFADRIAGAIPGTRAGRFWPEQAAQLYGQAKLAIIGPSEPELPAALFDAMGQGAMVIARDGESVREVFEDGVHLALYQDPADVVRLAEQYLADEPVRERIARAGSALVGREHMYQDRAARMVFMVLEAMGMLGGPSGESRFQAGGYYRAPRPELAAQVPETARRILDVGCGGGEFGRSLKQRGAKEVIGIEVVERAWELAKDVLDDALLGSIEDMDLPFQPDSFDCIVCGDVLEHLVEPGKALEKLARVLAPDGQVVMSIPNARFWDVVRMLASEGRWKYEDAGIMDRTHLRFFTAPEMAELVRGAGLEVVRMQPLSMWPADRLPRNPDGSLEFGRVLVRDVTDDEYQDFLTYQYLVVAGKPGADRLDPARRALEAGDPLAALKQARGAAGVDEDERKRVMARAAAHAGKLDLAEALYRDLCSQGEDPTDAGQYGIVLVAMNRPAEALPYLEQSVAAAPDNARVLGALGLALAGKGDAQGAFRRFREALEADFGNEGILTQFVETARGLGRLDETEPCLRRFTDYYPGNIGMMCLHARILAGLGRKQEAAERLETAATLDPGHPDVRAAQETLNDAE